MRQIARGSNSTVAGVQALLLGSKVSPEALSRPGLNETSLSNSTNIRQPTLSPVSSKANLLCTKALAAAQPELPQSTAQDLSAHDQTLRDRLDFKPRLSPLDVAGTVLIPFAICTLLYFGVHPKSISILYGLGMSLIYAAWVAIVRAVLLERQYSKRLVSVEELGDKDSKFPSIDGLKVHAKVHRPANGAVRALMHCFHGFGANVESWDSVQKQIAERAKVQISSHDKPGFGLTERPVDPKKYSTEFNAKIGRTILHTEAEDQQDSHKKVYIGHSMGAGSAASEAIRNPEDAHGLILVAPAIMVFDFAIPQGDGNSGTFSPAGQGRTVQFAGDSPPKAILERRPQKKLVRRLFLATTGAILAKCSNIFKLLLAPFTIISLRAAVRSRKFWEGGLGRAWFDKSKLTPKIVDAYRKPQLVKGWERGLVNFTSSRVAGNVSIRQVVKDAWNGRVKPLQAEQLAEVVAKHNIKVLIVHGKYDRVVPLKNSQRLASLIPSAKLVVWDRTGHLPHEENPEEFIQLTHDFVQDLHEITA